jgi:predicted Zn-dependent peptidase
METVSFDQLNETLIYEKMDNGLDVYVLPKAGFNKTYATFTTKYGSIDNRFKPLGSSEKIHVPDGIAHFLEHKLFEKEDRDVFQDFSKQGASANAFTSFTRTAYLFSSTSNVEKNLETLMDFVQSPYFTEETVEKEKGIIGQEIRMYDDNPEWRGYFGLIDAMYQNHPVKIDIAGTTESIAKIDKDLLYTCYETFYHPSNMLLFIVGPVDPEAIINQVRDNQKQKKFRHAEDIERFFDAEPEQVAEVNKIIKMPVQSPKCMIGIKEKNPNRKGNELLKHEMSVNIILESLFGKSSKHYESLYNDGLIDDSFAFDYTEEVGFGFAMIGGDSHDPDTLQDRVKEILLHAADNHPVTTAELDRVRKKRIGNFLRSLNSPEFIANQFTRYQFNEMNLFDVLPVLEQISTEDLAKVAKDFFDEKCISFCQVRA